MLLLSKDCGVFVMIYADACRTWAWLEVQRVKEDNPREKPNEYLIVALMALTASLATPPEGLRHIVAERAAVCPPAPCGTARPKFRDHSHSGVVPDLKIHFYVPSDTGIKII
ncbi:MAG TPA: hypothetical protein VGU64_10895 [Terriglobales bacterium]|nr:hypothetical protein [Terriglobales bacterium]